MMRIPGRGEECKPILISVRVVVTYKTREKYMYNMKKNTCPADVVEKGSIVVFRRELDKYMVKKMFQGYGERAGSWNKGIALVESQHGHNVSNAHLCHDYFRFYDIYLF